MGNAKEKVRTLIDKGKRKLKEVQKGREIKAAIRRKE
jgi:hypothetical protein